MEPIYPLTEENLDQFRGQLVCVVMRDGTRHVGILGHCRGGRLVLNEDAGDGHGEVAGQPSEAKGKRRGRERSGSRKGSRKQAGEAARAAGFAGEWGGYPEYGPWGGGCVPPYALFGPRLALDLALIALVFLIL